MSLKPQRQPFRQGDEALNAVNPFRETAPAGEERHEKQAHCHAGHNIGVHHGNVVDGVQDISGPAAEAVKPNRGEGSRHGGNRGSQQRDQQRRVNTAHDKPVLEQGFVPVQRETLPHRAGIPGVEGKDNEQENGQVEKQEHQADEQTTAQTIGLFHNTIASSSPSPKWFMMTMHTTTMTIITREMAAPRWGL